MKDLWSCALDPTTICRTYKSQKMAGTCCEMVNPATDFHLRKLVGLPVRNPTMSNSIQQRGMSLVYHYIITMMEWRGTVIWS